MYPEYRWANTRRIQYEGGACFVPVCKNCGRYVKADETVVSDDDHGLHPQENCLCSKCGRSHMVFEGFF